VAALFKDDTVYLPECKTTLHIRQFSGKCRYRMCLNLCVTKGDEHIFILNLFKCDVSVAQLDFHWWTCVRIKYRFVRSQSELRQYVMHTPLE
jgi:hypothetical protein